ncbi:MAG: TatD family hydrolase [Longimicrobiales bacterium]
MVLFDSHCHLTDAAFAEDLEDVLRRAREAGVTGVVSIASDLDDAMAAQRLASAHEEAWCTAGIHPHVAVEAKGDQRGRLRDLLGASRVVALGEAGLDYHYDNSPRDVQRRVFGMQLEIAGEVGLPVVVHSRDADDDMAAMIREYQGTVTGVLHCFTGRTRLLDIGLEADWYISFSGLITFRNYADAGLLRAVPEERLLLETDSPYLAPVPMRSKRNEPSFLPHTCTVAAQIRGAEPEALAAFTTRNARAFYGIGEPARSSA